MLLSFDCGTTTGYATMDMNYNLEKWGVIKGGGISIIDYMEEVRKLYKEILPEIVIIEEPFISAKQPTAIIPLVKFIQTVTIGVLLENKEALILSVSNKTVKKHVGGNGNCKKLQVFKSVVERYKDQLSHFTFKENNDTTDAVGLCIVGVKILKKEIVLK